ncbi:hypothetical protein EV356DRAFT_349903 [Viridothelium virens]|uniref:Uncharacterized protein n=1 Tax=Viridothelium virens TaxID=1048519 RepID=A0A6A6GWJ2_VIRVR|nr:hypothetical protein EV356DRAFT_349903 [Viridothelium virens]
MESFQFQYPPGPAENVVGCCPTGFSCGIDNIYENKPDLYFQTCIAVPTSTAFAAALCNKNETEDSTSSVTSLTVSFPAPNLSMLSMWAPLVQLVYQESDLSGFLMPSLPKSSSVPPKVHRRCAGVIVGIVIGALTLIVFMFALVWFLLLRRQRQMKRGNPNGDSAAVPDWLKAELPGQAKQLYEAGGKNIGRELPTGTTCLTQELEVPEVEGTSDRNDNSCAGTRGVGYNT